MSSVSSAGANVTTKPGAPALDLTGVESCKKITAELLPRFRILSTAPDILYWLMATWGAESNWNLLHKRGTPGNYTYSSLHYTPTNPYMTKSTIIGRAYQFSNVISNIWNDPSTTIQTKENIKEGWYPHGITACMGTYHVKGCDNNLQEWRAYGEAVSLIGELGLEVSPGQSIFQTLFPVDDETCRRRSIASGMIIFNSKYRAGLNSGRSEASALQYALGAYLGNAGVSDRNGVTPEMRVAQLNNLNSSIVGMLAAVDLRRSGDNSIYTINTTDKSARATGASSVRTNTATGATTNGGSNGKSEALAGCRVA